MKSSKKNGTRYCKYCGSKLKRNGHKKGKQIWICPSCHKIDKKRTIRKKEKQEVKDLKLYFEYSLNKWSMSDYGVDRSTIYRHTIKSRNKSIVIPSDNDYHRFVFLDGTATSKICTLIARDKWFVFKFQHVKNENSETWFNFIKDIAEPEVVICDGQKGLLKAIRGAWPKVMIQRCMFHVFDSLDKVITENPVLKQMQELKEIREFLGTITSFEEREKYISLINEWTEINKAFLKEKTICQNQQAKRSWFYTHKSARKVWRILLNVATSRDFFTYLDVPDCPKTNNHIEGGVNAQIHKLRSYHPGMTLKHRINMLEAYCFSRTKYWKEFEWLLKQNKKKKLPK